MTLAVLRRRAEAWNFDIDTFTNPYTPPSPLHRLPPWISRFLGYRREPKEDVGNVLGAVWSCVGAFCGLAVAAAVFNNAGSIQYHHPPAMIASFGASAVLEYNAIRSPFGQPRNAVFGHAISAIIGVSITKLFLYHSEFERIRWIAGAMSCGIASAAMLLTGTVHPPGGASAVLAATSPDITAMGWYFVPLVILGTMLMLVIGLIINNIQRQFPVYWWTPIDLRALQASRKKGDEEGQPEKIAEILRDGDEKANGVISVSAADISVPEDLVLSSEEERLLEGLRERLIIRRKEVEACNLDRVPSSRPSTDCTYSASRGERRGSNSRILDSSS